MTERLIIEFYEGKGTDAAGRSFEDVLVLNDGSWEHAHNYIQWLFPLPEPSRAQPQSPILTMDELNIFLTENEVRKNVKRAVDRWMVFMEKTSHWLKAFDHNHLRITRIIRFLALADFPDEADRVYLTAVKRMTEANVLTLRTKTFWDEARKSTIEELG